MAAPSAAVMYIKPQGASATESLLENVNIDAYSCEAVLAEDGVTPQGSRYHITGTCLVSVEDWSAYKTANGTNSSRMAYVRLPHPANALNKIIDLTSGSSCIGGPFLKLTGTQVVGTNLVLVNWDAHDEIALCDRNVVAHTWVQRTSLDQKGQVTRAVNGHIRVARSATASTVTPPNQGSNVSATIPWADLFRRAVAPSWLGEGWRRESQDFAYDASSTALVYQFVDKQYLYNLPNGVRVGDMDFTYERNAQDAGIGHLTCTVDLEGDISLKSIAGTTGNRRLVEAAVKLSKARINATYGNCIITRMRVTERGILSGFSIRFELEAQVFPASAPSGGEGAVSIVPLAFMIGQRFTVTRTDTVAVDPYGPLVAPTAGGAATRYYMLPHWLNNLVNGMNCDGKTTAFPSADDALLAEEVPAVGEVTVTVIADATGIDAITSQFAGQFSADQLQPPPVDNYTQIIAHSLSHTKVEFDSGMCRLSTMYMTGADFVFQTRKPCVRVRERVEISQANSAPAKVFRPAPEGAFLYSETWDVAFGKFDAQGNRMFTGIYERTYQMYDGGENAGFFTQTIAGLPSYRAWNSASLRISPTLSAVATTASQEATETVFYANVANNTSFTVNDETWRTP